MMHAEGVSEWGWRRTAAIGGEDQVPEGVKRREGTWKYR